MNGGVSWNREAMTTDVDAKGIGQMISHSCYLLFHYPDRFQNHYVVGAWVSLPPPRHVIFDYKFDPDHTQNDSQTRTNE